MDQTSTPTILRELHRDHVRLGRLLTAVRVWAEGEDREAGEQLDRIDAVIDYVSEYPDAVHHPLEDRVFARLLARPLTAGNRALVERNAAQHEELARLTAEMAAALGAATVGEGSMGAFAQQAAEFAEAQFAHMQFEEDEIFPLAARTLSASDWKEIEAEERLSHDPLFDQKVSRFASLYEYVVDDDHATPGIRAPTGTALVGAAVAPYLGAKLVAEVSGYWMNCWQTVDEIGRRRWDEWRVDVAAAGKQLSNDVSPGAVFAHFWLQQARRDLACHEEVFNAWSSAVERSAVAAARLSGTP